MPSYSTLCTRSSLVQSLQALPLKPGTTLLFHSSLSSLGFVVGGAETVMHALLEVLGEEGTLVAPAHSGDNSDPAQWCDPPVPEAWWQAIRDEMPAYNSATTRTRGMGVIAETARNWPGALRSGHPQTSFVALGKNAAYVTDGHRLDCALGEQSPLARLEELDAKVLLLGVGCDVCTAFHLAEYRAGAPNVENSFAVRTEHGRKWMTVPDLKFDDSGFAAIGDAFEQKACQSVVIAKVGGATCRLFSLREAVTFATESMHHK